jgi:TldD protein
LFFEYRETGHLLYEEGCMKAASRAVTLGLGVRVRKGDAVGLTCVDDLEWHAMARAAATAACIAGGGTPKALVPFGHRVVPAPYDAARSTVLLPAADKHALLERAAAAAMAVDHRVRQVEANLSDDVREILVATSDGRFVRDAQPLVRFAVRVVLESAGTSREGASGGGGRTDSRYFSRKTPEWHAQEAVRQAVAMLDAREAPAGTLPVVLAPGDSGILLHEAVGHGLEADFNRKGTSFYSGREGQLVASKACTVVDDATLPDSRGSITVDDEGNPGCAKVLIENGRLVGLMHDQRTAEHYGRDATGNGRRSGYAAAPMPRMTSTLLLAGAHDPVEIIRSVKRGIYARKLGGGQVNISNGSFVFALTESYLIEDGQLTAPVCGANLIGNGPKVLGKVSMLGNDMTVSDGIWSCSKNGQHVPVGVGCPTVKIDAITVGGTRVR